MYKFLVTYSVFILAAMTGLLSEGMVTAATSTKHNLSLVSGLFQQPTSQYYHQYYGGSYEYLSPGRWPFLRVTYAERPQFNNLGYTDQESTYNLLAGAEAFRNKYSLIKAYVGLGVFQGYIKPSNDRDYVTSEEKRTFRLNGIHAAMDAVVYRGPVYAALGHEMFVGYVDNSQLEAYVAWPVLFFNFRLGYLF
jgi:hypothetical protein